jgi:hypothetical protein
LPWKALSTSAAHGGGRYNARRRRGRHCCRTPGCWSCRAGRCSARRRPARHGRRSGWYVAEEQAAVQDATPVPGRAVQDQRRVTGERGSPPADRPQLTLCLEEPL